jgi:hypothetical protein
LIGSQNASETPKLQRKKQAKGVQPEYTLPSTEVLKFEPWPCDLDGGIEMQFHLIYEGPLHANTQKRHRVEEKHQIRRVFHKQLVELWKDHPFLKTRWELPIGVQQDTYGRPTTWTSLEASKFDRCGYRFLPLVGSVFDIACSLDILFLRRSGPGNLINKGGDIDNRVKVLFDALRIPNQCNELPAGEKPASDEEPFCCLLEDDQLITEVKITTDRLLTPIASEEPESDAHLVVRVRTLGTGASTFTALAG